MQPFHSTAPPAPGGASDAFVDALFDKLDAARQKTLTEEATASQSRARVAAAAHAWWDEFCEVLERKVGAWNAKDAPGAHVTCTRTPSGAIRLWHKSVEAELALAVGRIVMTGRIGNTRPRESPFIEFSEARGHVGAILAGEGAAKSPAEAADHLLAPILTHAFAGSPQPHPDAIFKDSPAPGALALAGQASDGRQTGAGTARPSTVPAERSG